MIIAFPPCTHLAISGARYFEQKRESGVQRQAIEFFYKMLTADCDKIVVENPINIISGENYIKENFPDLYEEYGFPIKLTQKIQPWWFGDNVVKTTYLWIKGVDRLKPEVTEQPEIEYKEWYDEKQKKWKKESKWIYDAFCKCHTKEERSRVRSKTFGGIARAMAEQWG